MALLLRTIGLLLAGCCSLMAEERLSMGRWTIRFLARSKSACVGAAERRTFTPDSPMPFIELTTVVKSARMGTSSRAMMMREVASNAKRERKWVPEDGNEIGLL